MVRSAGLRDKDKGLSNGTFAVGPRRSGRLYPERLRGQDIIDLRSLRTPKRSG